MNEKYILITGATGGLGKASVNELIKYGYKLFAIDKYATFKEEDNITYLQCDICNKDDLNRVYDYIINKTNNLYGIINLAGIFKMDSVYEGDIEKLKTIIDVNFYGPVEINMKFGPLLLEKGSRIVNCTSELAGYSAIPFNGYYTLPKTIFDKYSDTLRRELLYLGIKVVKVQAGSFSTGLLNGANNEYDVLINKTKNYKKQLTKLKYMMDNELKKTRDPKLFGKLIVKIMNKKNPKLCYKIKRSFKLRLMSALPERLQDFIYKKVVK